MKIKYLILIIIMLAGTSGNAAHHAMAAPSHHVIPQHPVNLYSKPSGQSFIPPQHAAPLDNPHPSLTFSQKPIQLEDPETKLQQCTWGGSYNPGWHCTD